MKGLTIAVSLVLAACNPQTAVPEAQASTADMPVGDPQTGLSQVPLTITSASGAHRFTVDVAASPQQQETGLMFVKSLAPDRGMIFPYDPPTQVAFWMRNTLIPLDMIFIRADGTIANIEANTVPLSLQPVYAAEPVTAVLEIAAGRAAELGISPGDRVEWTR